MRVDELIDQLAADVPAIPRRARAVRIGMGVAGGGAVALMLVVILLGVRPDFTVAATSAPFWMKWGFTLSVAAASFFAVQRLGQPGERAGSAWWWLAAPIALVLMMGGWELIVTPTPLRAGVWLGQTAIRCLLSILALSSPVYVGLAWSFRRLAPTRIRTTGFAVGTLAGAISATAYALSCPETEPAFLATWYVAGILSAGLLGMAIAPRLLRW